MLEGYCLLLMEDYLGTAITSSDQDCLLGLEKGLTCENCNNWIFIESRIISENESM